MIYQMGKGGRNRQYTERNRVVEEKACRTRSMEVEKGRRRRYKCREASIYCCLCWMVVEMFVFKPFF